jgi:hypothetical protein
MCDSVRESIHYFGCIRGRKPVEEWQRQRALCDGVCHGKMDMLGVEELGVGRLEMDGREVSGASDALALQGLQYLVSKTH